MPIQQALEQFSSVYLQSGQITFVVDEAPSGDYHVAVYQRFPARPSARVVDEPCSCFEQVRLVLERTGLDNDTEGWQELRVGELQG